MTKVFTILFPFYLSKKKKNSFFSLSVSIDAAVRDFFFFFFLIFLFTLSADTLSFLHLTIVIYRRKVGICIL